MDFPVFHRPLRGQADRRNDSASIREAEKILPFGPDAVNQTVVTTVTLPMGINVIISLQ